MSEFIEMIFNAIFEDIYGLESKMRGLILMDPCQASNGGIENPFYTFWSSAGSSIQTLLSGIALTICGVFFCVEFVKTFSRIEGTTYEAVVGVGLKLCLAKLAIGLGGKLMEALTATGNSIILTISSVSLGTTSTSGDEPLGLTVLLPWLTDSDLKAAAAGAFVHQCVEDLGTLESFGLIAIVLIPLLVVKASVLITTIMAYGRILELMLFHAFAPLPMGFLFLDNARIPKRFFASYFATVLQGIFMFVGYSIFSSKVTSIIQSTAAVVGSSDDISGYSVLTSMLFQIVIWSVMMIVIVMKSGSWASKVVGEG